MGLVYWLVEISTVTLPELKCQPVRRYLLVLGSVAGQTFQTIFHVAWSLPIVCDNYRYIYNKYIFTVVRVIVFSYWKLYFAIHILLVVKGVPHEGPLIELSFCALLIIFAL